MESFGCVTFEAVLSSLQTVQEDRIFSVLKEQLLFEADTGLMRDSVLPLLRIRHKRLESGNSPWVSKFTSCHYNQLKMNYKTASVAY